MFNIDFDTTGVFGDMKKFFDELRTNLDTAQLTDDSEIEDQYTDLAETLGKQIFSNKINYKGKKKRMYRNGQIAEFIKRPIHFRHLASKSTIS